MATIAELRDRIEALRAELAAVAEEFFRLSSEATALERARDLGPEFQRLNARINELRTRRNQITDELAAVRRQLAQLEAQPETVTSAGTVVDDAQTARANGSNVQTPPIAPQAVDADGIVNPVSIAVPTNAQPSTPTVPVIGDSSAPPTIPGGSGTSLNSAANSTGTAPVSTLPTRSAPNLTGPGTTGESVVSYVYRAVRVVSNFSKGRFTQEVEGAQIFFDVPVDQNITVADGRADAQTVDPQALLRRPVQNPNPNILANTQFDIGDAGILPRLNINPTALGTAATAPATSGTVSVSIPSISSLINSVTVTVTLKNGQTRTVENEADVQALLTSGQIDFREASVATAALAAKRAAQSPRTGTSYQTVKEY